MPFTLVTGPVRSGKSRFAESLVMPSTDEVIYIATSLRNPTDKEWQERIAAHESRRPPQWLTWEVPHDLPLAIRQCPESACCLVDSLGAWVANGLELDPPAWEHQAAQLQKSLREAQSSVILVAEEVGWGIVPAFASGRIFRDRLGQLVQDLAPDAGAVYLVVAGYALDLKKWGQSIHPIRSF